jgi:TatD DNase family protein
MLTDAHCHPFDLRRFFPGAEAERRRMGVMCAASATSREECAYNEELARQSRSEGAAPVLPCFAIHPQMPAVDSRSFHDGLETLETLAAEGRLAAVGEAGFDLYNTAFRETETIQDELFDAQLETALRYALPMVLHVRRAMHKVFARTTRLKKCRAVIFHSWSGTVGEGEALLKRGVNGFFSFGTTILLNHREAMRCCASFPPMRLLTETDAPYQPLRGTAHSGWADLPRILTAAGSLRREADAQGTDSGELEHIIEANFRRAFNKA